MKDRKVYLDWEIGFSENEHEIPAEWVKSKVPGAVQLDWAMSKNYPDYRKSDNYKIFAWMEDKYWTYKTEFTITDIDPEKKYFFISKGIDYEFEIALNGRKLFYQEGMYKYIELDITEFLRNNNELIIKIWPVPKTHLLPADHNQAAQSCKPAASYGWDWHPRLIPLGIWDETFIEIKPRSNIKGVATSYKLSEKRDSVELNIVLSTMNSIGLKYMIKLNSPSGDQITKFGKIGGDTENIKLIIKNPQLWYPIGYGDQNLYSLDLELLDADKMLDIFNKRIGFRQVNLIMNDGAWNEPQEFPKTRSVPPMQMVVNGIKIFCKGSNWVMPEIFYGTITDSRYKEMIDLAVGCNFNILRIWGGAIINKEFFFDYCDERGLLIWQEFPLACANYYDSEKYLMVLESEATAIIRRVSQHPSLALWCGGNELFNDWSGMTDQSLALRLLNKLCYENDPTTPFLPTSPIMGVGHGHYLFHDFTNDQNVFEIYSGKRFTGLTEFGVSGASDAQIIKEIIPDEDIWPPKEDTVWKDHHAFQAWKVVKESWLHMNILKKYFGEQNNLEKLVDNSQTLQAAGLKFIFEESRRMQPYCSMSLNWCFNDCWPAAANTSIISYPNIPKKAYESVKSALKPITASARIKKIIWESFEIFETELFILNDSLDGVRQGKINVLIQNGKTRFKVFEWNHKGADNQKNIAGPLLKYELPQLSENKFYLLLESENDPSINSHYLLFASG